MVENIFIVNAEIDELKKEYKDAARNSDALDRLRIKNGIIVQSSDDEDENDVGSDFIIVSDVVDKKKAEEEAKKVNDEVLDIIESFAPKPNKEEKEKGRLELDQAEKVKAKLNPKKINFVESEEIDEEEVKDVMADNLDNVFSRKLNILQKDGDEEEKVDDTIKKATPSFPRSTFKSKFSLNQTENIEGDKQELLTRLIKSPKSSAKKRKKKKNTSNIKIENFKINSSMSKKDSDDSRLDSRRSLLEERSLLLGGIEKLQAMKKIKDKIKRGEVTVEDRADFAKNMVIDQFRLNKVLKSSLIEKREDLAELGKNRESLVKVIRDKMKTLNMLKNRVRREQLTS